MIRLFAAIAVTIFCCQSMTIPSPEEADVALITLGNSGVGKSFIDNIIVGEVIFDHKFSGTSVTRKTEVAVTIVPPHTSLAVYNIPGLVELQMQNFDENKAEIDRAFQGKSAQIILFIFGIGQGGRITLEDYTTYVALNDAYEFNQYSMIFLLNKIKKFDSDSECAEYKAEVIVNLRTLLKWGDKKMTVLFAEDFGNDYQTVKVLAFKDDILKAISSVVPHKHTRVREVELPLTKIQNEYKSFVAQNTEILEKSKAQISDLSRQLQQVQANSNAEHERYLKLLDQVKSQKFSGGRVKIGLSLPGVGGINLEF